MKTRFSLVLLLLLILGVGCSVYLYHRLFDYLIEMDNLTSFKVEDLRGTHPTRLRISGQTVSSVAPVYKITTKTVGSAMVVFLHVGLGHENEPVIFVFDLTIPDSVNEVRVGRSITPVWKRAATPAKSQN